ncbi:MAG: ATP-binding protein [Clostridiales bacterium]|nr:ATP-binding protein [Clostridiales bacterium]
MDENGVGIKPQIYAEIFSSFYSTSPHSSGMGLFVSNSMAYHYLNGNLYLDQEFHDGTEMVISIPNKGLV